MRRFTLIILASVAAIAALRAQEQPLPLTTRAEQEQFLLHASLAGDTPTPTEARRSWRVTLDDGKRKHAATVEAADGAIPPLATIASTSRRTSWTNSSP